MTRILAGALVAATVFALVQSAYLSNVKADLTKARADLERWAKYQERAEADAEAAAVQCQDRVSACFAASRRIETIITREVPHDASGCPLRPLLSAGELSDATAPAAAPSPESVSAEGG